jgi:hypothetical protein
VTQAIHKKRDGDIATIRGACTFPSPRGEARLDRRQDVEGQMSCMSAVPCDLIDDETDLDLSTPMAANDNVEETFDILASEVVAILLSDGLEMLAG